jgi:hypothetical protein
MRPIFRTGLIHFCHLSPFGTVSFHFSTQANFWNCTIPPVILITYFIVFLPILLGLFSYTFYPQLFPVQFHRSVLLHFSTAAIFFNWTNTFLSSQPILELYPSIFLHRPIFGTVLSHLSLYFLISLFSHRYF